MLPDCAAYWRKIKTQHGRFARAGGADQTQGLPGRQVQRHFTQRTRLVTRVGKNNPLKNQRTGFHLLKRTVVFNCQRCIQSGLKPSPRSTAALQQRQHPTRRQTWAKSAAPGTC